MRANISKPVFKKTIAILNTLNTESSDYKIVPQQFTDSFLRYVPLCHDDEYARVLPPHISFEITDQSQENILPAYVRIELMSADDDPELNVLLGEMHFETQSDPQHYADVEDRICRNCA